MTKTQIKLERPADLQEDVNPDQKIQDFLLQNRDEEVNRSLIGLRQKTVTPERGVP